MTQPRSYRFKPSAAMVDSFAAVDAVRETLSQEVLMVRSIFTRIAGSLVGLHVVPGCWQAWIGWAQDDTIRLDVWARGGELNIRLGRVELIVTPWAAVREGRKPAACLAA